MDSVEVQEFLLTTATLNNSMLLETDNLFEKGVNMTTTDPDNSSSMYFSINDDTLSNRIVEQLDRTLIEEEEEVDEASSHLLKSSAEMSSVINTHLEVTTKDEEFFKMKLFPNQRSQCSTPKVEAPSVLKPKTPMDNIQPEPEKEVQGIIPPKLDGSLITDLILPLTTVLQKIEKKKVTIVLEEDEGKVEKNTAENKENIKAPLVRGNMRKSLKPRDGQEQKTVIPAKRPTFSRKSMIPNAPITSTTAAIKTKDSRSSLMPSKMAARKSVRLSVIPNTLRSNRFTMSGAVGKINSPKVKKTSMAPKFQPPSRLTMTARPTAGPSSTATTTSASNLPEEQKKPKLEAVVDKAAKRMSRIPFPGKSSSDQPRPDFTCSICKKTFHLKSTLTTHQKIHIAKGGAAFKCTYCDKDFEKEIGLRNHVERYCERVPVADKRKMNGSHNRTTSAEIKDRSKKDKSSSSRLESTSSSVGSSCSNSNVEQSEKTSTVPKKLKKEQQQLQPPVSAHPPASGLSPRKPIKSISHPHSGIKFSANKPIKCYHCQITFNKYVDFHSHVDKMHPQPIKSPLGKDVDIKEEALEGVTEN